MPVPGSVTATGPSGLVLGAGPRGPVTIRLFRPRPTRLVLAAPTYVTWLLAYRTMSAGAHLALLSTRPRDWQGLLAQVQAAGGTAEAVPDPSGLPEAGRPYRPSLILDDAGALDSSARLGAWQAVLATPDLTGPTAVHHLRAADLGLIAPQQNPAVLEAMRRAYALNQRQVRAAQLLGDDEVLLAMPRTLVRLAIRPTAGEHRMLFGG